MIARVWRGVIRAEHVEEYIKYIEATGGGEYKRTPGNRGAWTMSRIYGDRAEIHSDLTQRKASLPNGGHGSTGEATRPRSSTPTRSRSTSGAGG